MLSIISHLAVLFCILAFSQSKLYSRDFHSITLRTEKSWIYLDRMRFAQGEAKINFWAYLQTDTAFTHNNYKLNLLIIPQQLWDSQVESKCESSEVPQQLSKSRVINKQNGLPEPHKHIVSVSLNKDNNLNSKQTLHIHVFEQCTYYFVLADCQKSLVNQYFNKKSRFDIEVDITNNNKSYGPDEAKYTWAVLLLMAFNGLLISLLTKRQDKDQQDTNWPIVILKIIVWSHIGGLFFFYFGHIIYIAGKGNVYTFFPFVFLITSTVSEVLSLILLTFCAYGWMTTFKVSEDQQIFYPIATVIGILCLVLALLSKINDNEATKTHLYDSMMYDIMFIVKLVGLAIFLIGIARSSAKYWKNGAFLNYITRLALFGGFCFVAVPFFIYSSSLVSKHERWVSIFLTVQTIRTVNIFIMSWQMLSAGSIYNKLTLYGKSFMEHDNKYL